MALKKSKNQNDWEKINIKLTGDFVCLKQIVIEVDQKMTLAEVKETIQKLLQRDDEEDIPSNKKYGISFQANVMASLKDYYIEYSIKPSDINEHLPILRDLAKQCSSVGEIGLRDIVSTWGILQGLSESDAIQRFYLGIDLELPPENKIKQAQILAQTNSITFQFCLANDLEINFLKLDMLFIDSLHTYCHLTYELEKFSPYIMKYIAMHDTSGPYGNQDEPYKGDYSEYPPYIDKNKRGLWAAVEDFLKKHSEWELHDRYENNNGLTILKRK